MTAELAHGFEDRFSYAVSEVFRQRPYSFIVGGTTMIISIQLLGLGFISLQKKRYLNCDTSVHLLMNENIISHIFLIYLTHVRIFFE